MEFYFDKKKMAQSAHYLLSLHKGEGMDPRSLNNLLYLANREELIKNGYMLAGGKLCSYWYGPGIREVTEVIDGDSNDEEFKKIWEEYVELKEGVLYPVKKTEEFEYLYGNLSEYDHKVIDSIDVKYGKMGVFMLREEMSELDEWEEPSMMVSSPITPEEILLKAGWSEKNIGEVAEDAKGSLVFHEMLEPHEL